MSETLTFWDKVPRTSALCLILYNDPQLLSIKKAALTSTHKSNQAAPFTVIQMGSLLEPEIKKVESIRETFVRSPPCPAPASPAPLPASKINL